MFFLFQSSPPHVFGGHCTTKAGARANLGVKTGWSWLGTIGKSGDKPLDFPGFLFPLFGNMNRFSAKFRQADWMGSCFEYFTIAICDRMFLQKTRSIQDWPWILTIMYQIIG